MPARCHLVLCPIGHFIASMAPVWFCHRPCSHCLMQAVGVRVVVGYGLTETSPVLTVRNLACNVRGTIGEYEGRQQLSRRVLCGMLLLHGLHTGSLPAGSSLNPPVFVFGAC